MGTDVPCSLCSVDLLHVEFVTYEKCGSYRVLRTEYRNETPRAEEHSYAHTDAR